MGRISTKENKTLMQLCREEQGYSGEQASDLFGWISADRIEKIENDTTVRRVEFVI